MARISAVVETCLYVEDLQRARQFYVEVLGLEAMVDEPRFCALNVSGRSVLLLFEQGQLLQAHPLPGGTIPPHDGSGPVHVGFSIDAADFTAWETRLREYGTSIESAVVWPRGGKSMYFRDPDQHLVELLTPGVWAIY
jgi:catechol 2,3-dioxygenase-like lactoylglutathione lyase family enzyme